MDLTFIKDVTLIIGSLTATTFTLVGFNKWKKEHKGKLRYELSRKLLKSIFNLRDSFKSLRSPLIWASEFSPKHHSGDIKESEKYGFIFENRLKYLQNDYNEFLSLLPEVEIEYGDKLNQLCDELIKHLRNYHFKMDEYIQILDRWDNKNSIHLKLKEVIFNNNPETNQTTIDFNQTIENLKKELSKEIK